MKNVNFNFRMLLLALAGSAILFACKKEGAGVNINSEGTYTDASIEVMVNATENQLLYPTIASADEIQDFDLANGGIPEYLENEALAPAPGAGKLPKGCGCGKVLDSMGIPLSAEQKTRIAAAFDAFRNCREASVLKMKTVTREILERAQAARLKLLGLYKDGKITKAQLQDGLQQIAKKLKEELSSDERRKLLAKALRECEKKFLYRVKGILSEQQWKAWTICLKHCHP